VCKAPISSIAHRPSLNWTVRISRATVRTDLSAVVLRRLQTRFLQDLLLLCGAALLLAAAIPSPGMAQSPSEVTTVFKFTREVNWGGAIMPPGDYAISISSDASPVVTINQKGGTLAAKIAPKAVSAGPLSGNLRIVTIEDEDGKNYVSSLYLEDSGAMLTFGAPNPRLKEPDPNQQDADFEETGAGDAATGERSLLTIHSLRKQTVSYAEVRAIYLSACKTVEQEFNRPDSVRPSLTLLLGTDTEGLYYPKREIQLKKWDKYEFAEGVVMLAVADLLPKDKKLTLARLAVIEAESTVEVSELKSRKNAAVVEPRN